MQIGGKFPYLGDSGDCLQGGEFQQGRGLIEFTPIWIGHGNIRKKYGFFDFPTLEAGIEEMRQIQATFPQ